MAIVKVFSVKIGGVASLGSTSKQSAKVFSAKVRCTISKGPGTDTIPSIEDQLQRQRQLPRSGGAHGPS